MPHTSLALGDFMNEITEIEGLQERLRKLASDKSYLQLVIHMMNRLGGVATLEIVVVAIPGIILDSIGGTNVKLYYFIDQNIYCCNAFRNSKQSEIIDDEMVLNAKNSMQGVFYKHDFSDTMMLTHEFEKAWDWAYPLCVKSEVIGVVKMENLHVGVDEWREYLPIFFGYCALLLKNEILGFTKLKKAYDELAKEVETRKQTEEELETINNKLSHINAELEEEIAFRMETEDELHCANASLKELTLQLESRVEERTKELNDSNKKLESAYLEWIQAMDAFDDIIYLLDDKRHIVMANKKFYASFDINHEQGVGKLISDVVHPDFEPKECRICNAQIAFKDSIFVLDADDAHNPTSEPMEVTVKIIKNSLGEPVGILTSIHNISNSTFAHKT
jgi:PAS domain-containing protein